MKYFFLFAPLINFDAFALQDCGKGRRCCKRSLRNTVRPPLSILIPFSLCRALQASIHSAARALCPRGAPLPSLFSVFLREAFLFFSIVHSYLLFFLFLLSSSSLLFQIQNEMRLHVCPSIYINISRSIFGYPRLHLASSLLTSARVELSTSGRSAIGNSSTVAPQLSLPTHYASTKSDPPT